MLTALLTVLSFDIHFHACLRACLPGPEFYLLVQGQSPLATVLPSTIGRIGPHKGARAPPPR